MNLASMDIGLSRWLDFIDSMPTACDIRGTDGRFIQVNQAFESLYGLHSDLVVGRDAVEICSTSVALGVASRDREVERTRSPVGIEFTIQSESAVITVDRIVFPLHDGDDRLIAFGGLSIDVSARMAAALERSSDSRYQSLFEQVPVSIWEEDWSDAKKLLETVVEEGVEDIDAYLRDHPEMVWRMAWECSIIAFNEMTVSMYGAENKAAFWAHAITDFRTEDEFEAFRETLAAFAQGRQRLVVHAWEKTVDERDIYVRDTVFIPDEYHDTWARVVRVNEDVTESHRLSQKLTYEASHDALTGLINRREFEARLRRIIESSRGGHSQHALCYLDLDQFKIINDTCGHNAGDELLRQLSRELARHVRRRDTFARLGGDEFGVLLEHCSPDQARRLAETLREGVERLRFHWGERVFTVGVSIGLVPISGSIESISDVMSAADAACYTAKDQGRNRIHVYTLEDSALMRRRGEMRWANRIGQALTDDGFRLMFQPITPTDPENVTGQYLEVLLRLKGEGGDDILPDAFMRAAERYDLSGRIDRWVIERTFAWLKSNPEVRDQLALCCINISTRSIDEDDFQGFLEDCLDRNRIVADRICFEITETTVIGDLAHASEFMSALRERGCKFALDDFGSGVSSFTYLRELPIDYVKIDGSFVASMLDSKLDWTIVRAINDMGHALGARTIAERVESPEVRQALAELGVDFVQGFSVGELRYLDELDDDTSPPEA